MNFRRLLPALLVLAMPPIPLAHAKPVAPAEFCRIYPDTPACASGSASCTTCHTRPPTRNAYGMQVEGQLLPGVARPLSDPVYLSGLPAALGAVEQLDADGDGSSNLEELDAGSSPVDALSAPVPMSSCEPNERALAAQQPWNTCAYDPTHAFERVSLDFCGAAPAQLEVEAFRAAQDWRVALRAKLEACMDTAFWRGKDGVLWNMANSKILPEASLKGGENAGDIPIGDYDDDYNLFVYVNTDDRDVRELLTAQYHIDRQADGTLLAVERTPREDAELRGFESAQLVPPSRRAGMLTTRWFLVKNTMFTPIPRTTAAQAYRAYLGYDIAQLEGLQPVANEPVDHDRKGVTAPECAVCHSTLDPLSYPFTRYDGLGGGYEPEIADDRLFNPDGTINIANGNYVPARLERFVLQEGPQIVDTPEAGVLLEQPVADLLEWAGVAASSEAFARKVVLDYWRLLVGDEPTLEDQAEFESLRQRLSTEHGYRVELMLSDLVLTEAYGAP